MRKMIFIAAALLLSVNANADTCEKFSKMDGTSQELAVYAWSIGVWTMAPEGSPLELATETIGSDEWRRPFVRKVLAECVRQGGDTNIWNVLNLLSNQLAEAIVDGQ